MTEILKKPFSYTLIKKDNEYILNVVCGSVGLFEVEYKLSELDIDNYLNQGKDFIEDLAHKVRFEPDKFVNRNRF
jgi:hypothetical protein